MGRMACRGLERTTSWNAEMNPEVLVPKAEYYVGCTLFYLIIMDIIMKFE
jgi:hypothetical protein